MSFDIVIVKNVFKIVIYRVSVNPSSPSFQLPENLDRILRATSRSVYLTLKIVPRPMRQQLMLAYLFCRAADTIADTAVLPPEKRVEFLKLFRGQFQNEQGGSSIQPILEWAKGASGEGFSPAEKELLENLEQCFEIYFSYSLRDQEIFQQLLTTLTQGMALDLEVFPSEKEAEEEGKLAWLQSDEDLDRYCYYVAGCVGEFWTDLQFEHVPVLKSLSRDNFIEDGIRFGKGLQMTNVLRDLPEDLQMGRCYIPLSRLEAAGIDPNELKEGLAKFANQPGEPQGDDLVQRLKPIYDELLDLTLNHFEAGWRYTLNLPRRAPRLRLACAWPLLIGLETLTLLRAGTEKLLRGERLKIPRSRVYQLILASSWRVFSNDALDYLYRCLEREAKEKH